MYNINWSILNYRIYKRAEGNKYWKMSMVDFEQKRSTIDQISSLISGIDRHSKEA